MPKSACLSQGMPSLPLHILPAWGPTLSIWYKDGYATMPRHYRTNSSRSTRSCASCRVGNLLSPHAPTRAGSCGRPEFSSPGGAAVVGGPSLASWYWRPASTYTEIYSLVARDPASVAAFVMCGGLVSWRYSSGTSSVDRPLSAALVCLSALSWPGSRRGSNLVFAEMALLHAAVMFCSEDRRLFSLRHV